MVWVSGLELLEADAIQICSARIHCYIRHIAAGIISVSKIWTGLNFFNYGTSLFIECSLLMQAPQFVWHLSVIDIRSCHYPLLCLALTWYWKLCYLAIDIIAVINKLALKKQAMQPKDWEIDIKNNSMFWFWSLVSIRFWKPLVYMKVSRMLQFYQMPATF